MGKAATDVPAFLQSSLLACFAAQHKLSQMVSGPQLWLCKLILKRTAFSSTFQNMNTGTQPQPMELYEYAPTSLCL